MPILLMTLFVMALISLGFPASRRDFKLRRASRAAPAASLVARSNGRRVTWVPSSRW